MKKRFLVLLGALLLAGLALSLLWFFKAPTDLRQRAQDFLNRGEPAKALVLAKTLLIEHPEDDSLKLLQALAYDRMGVEIFPEDICEDVIHYGSDGKARRDCALLLGERAQKQGLTEAAFGYFWLAQNWQSDPELERKLDELRTQCQAESETCSMTKAQEYLQAARDMARRDAPYFQNPCLKADDCPFLNQVYNRCEALDDALLAWLNPDEDDTADLEPENIEGSQTDPCGEERFQSSDLEVVPENFAEGENLSLKFENPPVEIGLVSYDTGEVGNTKSYFLQMRSAKQWSVLAYLDQVYNPGAFGIFNDFAITRFTKQTLLQNQESLVLEYTVSGTDSDPGINRYSSYEYRQLILCGSKNGAWQCAQPILVLMDFQLVPMSDGLGDPEQSEWQAQADLVAAGLLPTTGEFVEEGEGEIQPYLHNRFELTYQIDAKTGTITLTPQSVVPERFKSLARAGTFAIEKVLSGEI